MAENRVKVNSCGGEICPGCSSKYAFNIDNLSTKLARIIPECGHNLCEQCVVTEGTSTGQVRCQHSGCSTKILWTGTLDVFLPNMLVLGRVVYLQQCPPVAPNERNASSVAASLESHVVCGECDDESADCFCHNCDTNLCSPCFNNIHKHAKSLMKHKSLPLAMDDTGRKVLQLLKIPDCVEHMKRIQYVADDGGVGCEGCLKLGKLRGLPVNTVESYNQKKRKDLEDKVMEGKNKLDRLKSVRASLKDEDEEVVKFEELASKIKLHFSNCYGQLQTLEHHLCKKLETQLKTKQTENERLVKIISEKINEVSSFLKIAEEAVSKDSGIATYNFNEMIEYIAKLEYPSRPNSLELNLNVDPSFLNLLKSHVDLIEKEVSGVNDAPLRQVPGHHEDPTNTDQTFARLSSGHLNTQKRLISTSEGGEKPENLSPVTIFSQNIIHGQESGDSLQSESQDEIEQLVENVANTRSESPNSAKVFKSSHIDNSEVADLDTIPVKELSNKPMTHSKNTFKSQTEKSSKDIVKTDYVICVYNENFVGTYQSLNGNGGKENNNDPVIDIRNVVRNKNAKIKKPCKYFNEGSCEVKRSHLSKSRLTQWLHVCRFCFAKYGNEKLHPESQCEYKKNANDEPSSGMPRSVDESKRNKKVGDEDENIMKEERRSWKREGSYENGDSKRRRSRSRERSSRSNYRSRSRERERSSERWNGREVKVDREAVEMDRSRDDHRKRSRYSQERERDRRGDVDRNREVDRSRKYEDGFKRTRQDLQVEDDHRISKRERDDREDLQARNSSLGHETVSLSNQPRNAEASQLQYPEKSQEDEIQLLHRKVADCVKKRLNMYWAHIETTEPKNWKINDPEEYTKLAKHFSHRMRDQIKESYEQYERTLEGITLTADNREQIKTAIDMHFDSKPEIELEGYRR